MQKKYKYKYAVEEYSQDSRHFIIESDVMLDEDTINDCITNVSLDKQNSYSADDYQVSFIGTKYGDDCQINIDKIK